MPKNFLLGLIILATILLQSCANIVPPSGGPVDTSPPVLLSSNPKDSSLNITPKLIVLRYNKYMNIADVEDNFQISPLVPIQPVVTSYGKRVEIKIADTTLEKNTTYHITYAGAIVDNREATAPAKTDFLFSTGSFFDSLSIAGTVLDAASGLPDTSGVVVLYPADKSTDTSIFRNKPLYVSRIAADGTFKIPALPQRSFRIFALYDKETNLIYDPNDDKIGFHTTLLTPKDSSQNILIRMFAAEPDTSIASSLPANNSSKPKFRNTSSEVLLSAKVSYKVALDTLGATAKSHDINKPITIAINSFTDTIIRDKIFLSFDRNGTEVEAISKVSKSDTAVVIQTDWSPGATYTLRLVKGWAKDTTGAELMPGKYIFKVKSVEDYGNITLNFDSQYVAKGFLAALYLNHDSIITFPIAGSSRKLERLIPGTYTLRVIKDEDGNGRYTTGDVLAHRQPELVIPADAAMPLRAGWTQDFTFTPKVFQTDGNKPSMRADSNNAKLPAPNEEEPPKK